MEACFFYPVYFLYTSCRRHSISDKKVRMMDPHPADDAHADWGCLRYRDCWGGHATWTTRGVDDDVELLCSAKLIPRHEHLGWFSGVPTRTFKSVVRMVVQVPSRDEGI